ncbi:prepilin-type N-terminal cleavage/methylation domain-containing protein [Thiomicrorhabdus sp. zzn3]|uniref:prepilin-type N-terminal cleavage/methylation domain-containing protein n=1 Tax=Thiomicrorhabdus sp. zzn3 TaxID=3039775 RepID=UPI0024373EED|nr:prepilin-type N-terminal cleavage/methylation domain-containing protein [Thiomicrorhabdus sp. zzn3]MDG6779111.1 prepilin-type N-terminal cleavage/methylation domain-containing protein [Thiomicrorhabdus sp. zzn3]
MNWLNRDKQRGFSLIEIAIGLLVLGLLIGSFSGVFKLFFDSNHKLEEQVNMERIEKSLNTFLLVNSYIPCPDTDGDGHEDRNTVSGIEVCADREGALPFNDLGVEENDAWGNPYYYRVHQRAESATYVNDICEPASVLGRSGPRSKADLWMCPETNLYYCADISSAQNCNTACSVACTNTTDPRPATNTTLPPFFHLVTPPYGSVPGSYNLTVTGEDGVQKGEGVVAVVVSWGANGGTVNRDACSGGTVSEEENCDDDRNFIDTQTGENRDFLAWVTVNQAKTAIILTGELR